jgi:recombination protein RecA
MDKSDKIKLVKEAMTKINKEFGDGSVMSLSDAAVPTEVISTGSFGLDIATGVNGLPKGRVVEIFGPESSGKTTIATHVIAECQKNGGVAAVIDVEHAFDREYAKKLGVNVDELIFNQPDNGEQALQIADELICSGGIDVIVIDSVAALVTKSELEGDMGDSKMGQQARLMGQAMRKITPSVSKNNVLCIFINQIREKIGIMFGNPETTSGGNALKFYASMRLDVRRSTQVKDGDFVQGNKVKVKVIKNKVAPPFRLAEFDIIFGEGIDKTGEIVDQAIEFGIIKKGGSWLAYQDTKIQGRDSFRQLLKDNPELSLELETKIKEKIYAEA